MRTASVLHAVETNGEPRSLNVSVLHACPMLYTTQKVCVGCATTCHFGK